MRLIITFAAIAAIIGGVWFSCSHKEGLNQIVESTLPAGEFRTLEIRFSADEIMQNQKAALLKNKGYNFLEPKLLFYPYLLMDVKYAKGTGETGEGSLLWGLNDGEMVIDTANWQKTHGYEDCLAAKADKNDFKIICALAENGGLLEKERLMRQFSADQDAVDKWIESSREKKLIVVSGNRLRLHFQNPRMQAEPVTLFEHPLVTQATKNSQKMKGEYSLSQIRHLAENAFGTDFAIRKTQEVFLPVFAIAVQNPDGSILTTYWNALNGKQFDTCLTR